MVNHPRRFAALCCGIVLFGINSLLYSQDNYASWSYYKNIVLNTRTTGAGVTNTVTKFPVLVRLTSADSLIFKTSANRGLDVRFSKWDGTHLPYQIERWDSLHGKAELWVLADTVRGADSTEASYANGYMKMFWGKSGAGDSSQPTAVFDTGNGYQAAWHLGEAAGATANDATVNGYSATPSAVGTGSQPADTEGVIGRAKYFAGDVTGGANGGIYLTTMASPSTSKVNFDNRAVYTLSAWVLADTLPITSTSSFRRTILQKGNSKGSPGNWNLVGMYGSTTQPVWQGGDYPTSGTGTTTNEWLPGNATKHVWQHVVFSRITTGAASSDMNIYVNGVLSNGTWSSSTSTGNVRSDATQIGIGASSDKTLNFFKGLIDEVEISSVSRSADWVKLSYQNQQPSQTLVMPGPIQQMGLPAPVLSSPSNGAANQQVSLSLAWNTVSGATSYEVQIATTSTFGTTIIDQAGLPSPNLSPAGLLNTTFYYWRVNAAGGSGPGAWSSIWSFSTLTPWIAPPPVSPANGAIGQPLSPGLSWIAVSNATSYEVQVSTDPAFGTTFIDQSALTGTSLIVPGLSNYGQYYWHVNAYGAAQTPQTTAWSGTWSFTTLIGTPALSLPSNAAVNQPLALSLSWGTVTGAASYAVQVAANSGFSTTAFNFTGLTGSSQPLTGLSTSATYYWRTSATGGNGSTGSWSTAWSFTTLPPPPGAPTLTLPSNGWAGQSLTPTLTWSSTATALSYEVQAATISDFSTTVLDISGLTATSQPIGPLSMGTVYYWHVNASNIGGASAWSTASSFTTVENFALWHTIWPYR